MNFLGVGTGELLVILLLTVLVMGPERMVETAGKIGRTLVKMRRMFDEATEEFREATQEVRDVLNLEGGDGSGGGERATPGSAASASGPPSTSEAPSSPSPLTSAALAAMTEGTMPAGDPPTEVEPAPTPEELVEFEALLLEKRLSAQLVDGEVDVEFSSEALVQERYELGEDLWALGQQVVPVTVDLAQIVPEDEDVAPTELDEAQLVGELPGVASALEPAGLAEPAPVAVTNAVPGTDQGDIQGQPA